MERDITSLRTAGALVQQELEAWRYRTCGLSLSTELDAVGVQQRFLAPLRAR